MKKVPEVRGKKGSPIKGGGDRKARGKCGKRTSLVIKNTKREEPGEGRKGGGKRNVKRTLGPLHRKRAGVHKQEFHEIGRYGPGTKRAKKLKCHSWILSGGYKKG